MCNFLSQLRHLLHHTRRMIFGYFTTLYRQIHVDVFYANVYQFCNYMSKCATFGSLRNVFLFDVFADRFQKVVLKICYFPNLSWKK